MAQEKQIPFLISLLYPSSLQWPTMKMHEAVHIHCLLEYLQHLMDQVSQEHFHPYLASTAPIYD